MSWREDLARQYGDHRRSWASTTALERRSALLRYSREQAARGLLQLARPASASGWRDAADETTRRAI